MQSKLSFKSSLFNAGGRMIKLDEKSWMKDGDNFRCMNVRVTERESERERA